MKKKKVSKLTVTEEEEEPRVFFFLTEQKKVLKNNLSPFSPSVFSLRFLSCLSPPPRSPPSLQLALVLVEVVVRPGALLLLVLGAAQLVDAWPVVCGVAPKGDVKRLEERVHAGEQRLRPVGRGALGGLAVVYDDAVCKVGSLL